MDTVDSVNTVDMQNWPCPGCGDSREFLQPPCGHEHREDGDGCPEWACVDCGHALLVATLTPFQTVPAHRAA